LAVVEESVKTACAEIGLDFLKIFDLPTTYVTKPAVGTRTEYLKHWHLYLATFDIVNDITHGSETADYKKFVRVFSADATLLDTYPIDVRFGLLDPEGADEGADEGSGEGSDEGSCEGSGEGSGEGPGEGSCEGSDTNTNAGANTNAATPSTSTAKAPSPSSSPT
jgi:hypothetical protein